MTDAIIWLHEDALRITHPVCAAAPHGARILHIWDDAYLQTAGYSLKRLVFLYETLCQLPLEIIRGDTLEVLLEHAAPRVYVPASVNPFILHVKGRVSQHKKIVMVADEPFANITKPRDFTRFFSYWKQAEKTAFLPNGGGDA